MLQEVTHGGKSAVLKLLEQLPGETMLEEIQYHLYVLQKIRASQNAVDTGHVIPQKMLCVSWRDGSRSLVALLSLLGSPRSWFSWLSLVFE